MYVYIYIYVYTHVFQTFRLIEHNICSSKVIVMTPPQAVAVVKIVVLVYLQRQSERFDLRSYLPRYDRGFFGQGSLALERPRAIDC